jgi:protein-tyrosine phosphatase
MYWSPNDQGLRLAIMARPRGGEWLGEELAALRAQGIAVLVSALTSTEEHELDLAQEAMVCEALGLEFVRFPIEDRDTPRSVDEVRILVRRLLDMLRAGQPVAIHCRAGIGRSAVLAACLLVETDLEPGAALERIATARGAPVPDTDEQRAWVEAYAGQRRLAQLLEQWR